MPVQNRERMFDEPRLLLVEGRDDFHVISALCKVGGLPENFSIFDCGSDDKVFDALSALLLKAESPEIIGVVLDADENVESRWQSIRDKLQNYPYRLPNAPDPGGNHCQSG